MRFSELAVYLEKLEGTSKRLEITDILFQLISDLSAEEVDKAVYLSLGYLSAQFKKKNFNIADKMMIRALEQAYQSSEVTKVYKDLGDLGDTALQLHTNKKDSSVSLTEVHTMLTDLAALEGTGSQDAKTQMLGKIIKSVNGLSAKFVVRIVLGTTRLGFTELTVIDALAKLVAGGEQKNLKNIKKQIESRYFIHPDIGLIAKLIKENGLKGIEKVQMEPGVPILSQKAQRAGDLDDAFERIQDCWAEYKFDGTRVQLHMDKKVKTKVTQDLFSNSAEASFLVETFTRNLEETTHQFPDIVAAAKEQIDAESIILDGEAIGYDKETGDFLPFQEIMQRKRKHSIKEMTLEIPITYFVFDILYLNGKPVIELSLEDRNKLLQKVIKNGKVIKIAEHIRTTDRDTLQEYYEKAKEFSLEGLIVKNPNCAYEAGARSYSWIKLKKADEKLLNDSIDAVVLGYYDGKGTRSKFGIGGFLIGVYDSESETFKTISKVGTGLKDEDWEYLKQEVDKYKVTEIPKNVEIPKLYTPDGLVKPKIVVEIGADEVSVSKTHSAGFALRFPRLLFFRTDKNPVDTTGLSEIVEMHKSQKRGTYVAN